MAALCVCAALAAGLSLDPNKLLELRIPNGCAYSHLPRLEAALATKNVEALLLIVEDGENDQDDAAMLATLPAAERIALLEREASIREQLRAAAGSMPVIAVSTSSVLEGACAGLVLAAAHRIMTERTTLCLHGTRFGLLASGLSRVSAIVPDDKRSVAMAVALGAMQCNVHDAERLQLARFVPSTEIPELLAELRCAPAAFIDVPLSRRCQSTPDQYANVFVDSSLIQVTLDEIFGDRERGSAAEVLARLETQAARARALIEMSYSRHTRECAEQALRAIEEASSALDPRMSSPSALAATVALMRVLWAPPQVHADCHRWPLIASACRRWPLTRILGALAAGSATAGRA